MSRYQRTRPLARVNDRGEATLSFPYNAALVARLKTEIPAWCRAYAPATKQWTVDPSYAARAIVLLCSVYPDTTVEPPGRRPAPPPVRRADHAFAIPHLLPSAPPELLDAAYRVLARLCHPDAVGGDGEAMRALNDAYADVKAKAQASA